jgi:hypothetical protein
MSDEAKRAIEAGKGVIADLMHRRSIKHVFSNIDHDVRIEIVENLAEIVRITPAQ